MNDSTQKTILLVEDDMLIGLSSKSSLEDFNYNVIVADTGERAVAIIKEKPDIDLILMDIDLGSGINGIQASELILSEKDIPVVFVSSHNEQDIISLTERVTSFGYVVKSSSYIVYDTSIKMAFRLFYERRKTQKLNTILNYSLDQVNEALFISDIEGNVIYCNDRFAMIRHKISKKECLVHIAEYAAVIDIFDAEGHFLPVSEWASSCGLRGETSEGRIFYISTKSVNRISASGFSYSPIRNRNGDIIGSFVSIDNLPVIPEKKIIEKIEEYKTANYQC